MDDIDRLRRRELADFLRTARGRLSPDELGLPASGRRRTPGLRREEVAQAAGVGLTWYTWLEQARPINVSEQVLAAIARALHLGPDETDHVLALAGLPRRLEPGDGAVVTAGRRAVLDALRPLPAAILDAKFDILAWNSAYRFFHGDIEAWPAAERNCLALTFLDERWNSVQGDRTAVQANYVATMRAAHPAHVSDPAWRARFDDLMARSAEFRTLWERGEVRRLDGIPVRHIRNPLVGDLRVRTEAYTLPGCRGAKMSVWLPDDAPTEERLRALDALADPGRGAVPTPGAAVR